MSVIESDFIDGVMTITMADESNRNALSRKLLAELTAVLDDADADPAVRVVVLTNSGRVFCAGADLSERLSSRSSSSGDRGGPTAQGLFGRFRDSPKPYVGRINGHCVAGGMGLAAAMDISIARADAVFGFTEVRVGVAPAMISVLCLPKMRRADASAAFLRGNRFSAAEAVRLGLINKVVPSEEMDTEIKAVTNDLIAGGPAALAACKQLLNQVPELSFDDALAWTGRLSAELFASEEATEGMAAFLGKRSPSWVPTPDEQTQA